MGRRSALNARWQIRSPTDGPQIVHQIPEYPVIGDKHGFDRHGVRSDQKIQVVDRPSSCFQFRPRRTIYSRDV
jgi:hypothetical protein